MQKRNTYNLNLDGDIKALTSMSMSRQQMAVDLEVNTADLLPAFSLPGPARTIELLMKNLNRRLLLTKRENIER